MAEYIDKKIAKEAVTDAYRNGFHPAKALDIIPAADVKPVLRGEWIHGKEDVRVYTCAKTNKKYFMRNKPINDNQFRLDKIYFKDWVCSVCGKPPYSESVLSATKIEHNYCPNCGAYMRGSQDEKDA